MSPAIFYRVAFRSRNREFEAAGFNYLCVLSWINWFILRWLNAAVWDEILVWIYNRDLRENFEGVFWFILGTWVTRLRNGGLGYTALPVCVGLWSVYGLPSGVHPAALAPQSASLSNYCSFWAVCLYVVCVEAVTWGRWPQMMHAHLFHQCPTAWTCCPRPSLWGHSTPGTQLCFVPC